ncbi:MAG TPA: hypothetical protein VHG89_04290 [Verrucomicrobiae bacterium]|nr:hypothetical protein [Verrucomicrobiae bacterium]
MLGDFLKFWLGCLLEGFHIADGAFGIIEGICIFIGAALRWHDKIPYLKKYTTHWEKWEGVAMKWAVAIFLVSFLISTFCVAPFLKYTEKNNDYEGSIKSINFLTQSNAFLNGQIQGQSNLVNVLQKQIEDTKRDNETALLNLKTDLNEANRQRDVTLQRLDFFEANPDKLFQIYSNIFIHTPTNFEQIDLLLSRYNSTLSKNLAEIETEASEIKSNATNQFSDLGIEKLPDGRTKFGGVVTGSPRIIMAAMEAGRQNALSNDFSAALPNFQKAITAFESTKSSGAMIDTSRNLTTFGKSLMYSYAGVSAMKLGSNSLAIEYQKKSSEYAIQAEKENPEIREKLMLISTFADLGIAYMDVNDFTNSFESFNAAITNYESLGSSNNLEISKTNVLRLYGSATLAAVRSGKTNEAFALEKKTEEIFNEITNSANPH